MEKKTVASKALGSKSKKKKPVKNKKLTKAQQEALKKKEEAERKKIEKLKKEEAYKESVRKKSKIGNFGKTIVFSVSSDKILTPKNVKRTYSARWEQHKLLRKPPKHEFVGREAANMTMTVVLDAAYGIKPRSMIGKIEKAIREGTVDYLVIGGKFVGGNKKMYISSCTESWDEIWNKGELIKATVNLTFSEYT